jgi:uncharacterized SAM-binding protein YcdF (DUF218 family)
VSDLSWALGRRRSRSDPRGWLRRLGLGLVALGFAWCAGFGWFLWCVSRPLPPPTPADGIVALTGGADRIHAALKLLAEGRADGLLVTGIGGNAGLRALGRQAGMDATFLAGKVTLGRGATSTRGNAVEIAAWARAHHVGSLIVVTAAYHMPRALTEIARALPDVRLIPAAVQTPAGPRLLAEEYTKLLGAALDLSALAPSDSPQLSAAAHGGAGR